MTPIRSLSVIVALAAVSLLPDIALAQRREKPSSPGERNTAPIAIALAAGGTQYAVTGQGTCEATEQASIYSVPAALWKVRHRDGGRSVTLTLWQPKNGSASMMSFGVTLGGKAHEVNTVKVEGRGEVEGSGTAKFEKQGAGGLFTIDATAGDGAKIKGTIRCSAFAAPIAEGG